MTDGSVQSRQPKVYCSLQIETSTPHPDAALPKCRCACLKLGEIRRILHLGPTHPTAIGVQQGVKLTTHLLLSRLRMRRAIPPLPKYAFMAWYLVKHRENLFSLNAVK